MPSSTLDTRRPQMFPRLTPEEVARIRRFGEPRRDDLYFVVMKKALSRP